MGSISDMDTVEKKKFLSSPRILTRSSNSHLVCILQTELSRLKQLIYITTNIVTGQVRNEKFQRRNFNFSAFYVLSDWGTPFKSCESKRNKSPRRSAEVTLIVKWSYDHPVTCTWHFCFFAIRERCLKHVQNELLSTTLMEGMYGWVVLYLLSQLSTKGLNCVGWLLLHRY